MEPVIDNVKAYVNKCVEGLNSDQRTIIDWRIRAMGYGDLEKGEKPQNSFDFVTDVEEFQSQLSGIDLVDGGDVPESTLDAIIVAAKSSKWRRAHKIVAIFTDAPSKELHSSTKSTFAINDLDEMIQALTEGHIKLFLWGASDSKYEKLKLIPKSEITIMSRPHEELSSGTSMAKLLELMGKTVTATIGSDVL